jgi:hypothetical protein
MKHKDSGSYITCPNKKGLPKKHIAVCRECNRKKRCKPYQDYIQPSLFPFR